MMKVQILCVFYLLYIFGCDGLQVKYTQISTTFNSPVGIDFHEPSNTMMVTAFYFYGNPYNFLRIKFNGDQSQFSTISGLSDEVKIATVKSGNTAGFVTGDMFTGTGVNAVVMRITDDGLTPINNWCKLAAPGFSDDQIGLMRGSLYIDRTGVFGNQLVVCTTGGFVFQIDSECLAPKYLGRTNTHLEGVITVPNEPATWGGLAGKILAGAELEHKLYAIDPNGVWTSWTVSVAIEDLDIIPLNENFFGVNYGTGRVLGVDYTQWANYAGKILVTEEFTGLYVLTWDFVNNSPAFETVVTAPDSPAFPSQWEHVSFGNAGIVEILPADFSACANLITSGGVTTKILDSYPLKGAQDLKITPFKVTTTVSNYNYVNRKANIVNPSNINDNTLTMFLTQDSKNEFALNIIAKSVSAGSVTLLITSEYLGPDVTTKIQDDSSVPISPQTDPKDSFLWSNGGGRFDFSWSAGSSDGVVLAPIDLVSQSGPFKILISISGSPTGITAWNWLYFNGISNSIQSVSIPLSESITVNRFSCNCNNGILDRYEQCDGEACCEQCAFRPNSFNCRPSAGECDFDEFCSGTFSSCPADTVRSSNYICRNSQGFCDEIEKCTGTTNVKGCPADLKNTGKLCRANVSFCDAEERCNGGNDCPADGYVTNGTPCDDDNVCTAASTCTNGLCFGPDTFCNGTCGDGVVAAGEQCDDADPAGNNCCQNCRFKLSTMLCRASSARCDPAEYCTGASGVCPADIIDVCPVCDRNCSGNGLCIFTGVCDCDPGHVGSDCSVPTCDIYANCSSCSTNNDCGWCCDKQKCISNEEAANPASTCSFIGHQCTCGTGCTSGGTCVCGNNTLTCDCLPGTGGVLCEKFVGCDGIPRDTPAEAPQADVCNICDGNGTTCIGCDGVPFGLKYDNCGICGGDGQSCFTPCPYRTCADCVVMEFCNWCEAEKTCLYKSDLDSQRKTCAKQTTRDINDCTVLGELTATEAAGIGAGIIAAIVIGAAAAIVLASLGGKKGYDAYMKNQNSLSGAQSNPMYTDNGRTGQNPFYANEMQDMSK